MKTKKVWCGEVHGGRAGEKYFDREIEVPLTLKEFEEWYEKQEEEVHSIALPGEQSDYSEIIKALKANECWAGFNEYGEGVIGFGLERKDVELAVRRIYMDDSGMV